LAYPYGKRGDISEAVLGRLPALGIECCFGAYGGTNPPAFDPLRIKRQGVDHGYSMLALRAVVEGWGSRSLR
jgi:hypothetical protein